MHAAGFLGQAFLAVAVMAAAVYAPGRLALRCAGLQLPRLETFTAAMLCGSALLTLFYMAAWWLGCPALLWVYAALAAAGEWFWHYRARAAAHWEEASSAVAPESWWELWPLGLIVLSGMIAQGALMVRSGWLGPQGVFLLAWHGRDAPWHIYNILQMSRHFPPEMGGMAGYALKNYHWLADGYWAALRFIAPWLNPWHIYFRIAPFFYSGLLCCSVFIAARAWFESRRVAYLSTLLAVFASNFGFLMPLVFRNKNYPLWDSIFWVQSPLGMIFNPGVMFAFALLMTGLWALIMWLRRERAGFLGVMVLLWGVLPGFKIYPALLVLGALAALAAVMWIWQKKKSGAIAFLSLLPLYLLVFLPSNSGAPALVRFLPGFNLGTMLVAPDRMALMTSLQLKLLYVQKPWLVALLMAGLLAVFIIGNLGVRCLALRPMAKALFHPRQADPVMWFAAFFLLEAAAGSVLFVQTNMPWNTIQFFYFALVLAAIPAAKQFWDWVEARPREWQWGLAGAFFLFSLPGNIQFFKAVQFGFFTNSEAVAGYQWLGQNARPDEVLIRPLPDDLMTDQGYAAWLAGQARGNMVTMSAWNAEAENLARAAGAPLKTSPAAAARPPAPAISTQGRWDMTDTAAAASLSGLNSYLENLVTARNMDYPVNERAAAVRRFYLQSDEVAAREFLEKEHIKYVILFPGMTFSFDPNGVPMKKVFENRAIMVYKFIDLAADPSHY